MPADKMHTQLITQPFNATKKFPLVTICLTNLFKSKNIPRFDFKKKVKKIFSLRTVVSQHYTKICPLSGFKASAY